MGCGCNKNKINDKELNVSQENQNNVNPEELLHNKKENENNKENKEEKNTTLIESKIQESIIDLKNDENKILKNNQYNKRVFELINIIRLNPPDYSKIILDNIQYISFDEHEELNNNNGIKESKNIIVFKKKVKVKLFKGEEKFKEAAHILDNTPPMEKLIFNEDIIIPLPNNEKEKNSELIRKKTSETIVNKNINVYFKDYIKNPEIAVLLMIVGDNENYKDKKREAILNKDFKYIGINSKFIGKNFIAHYSFSK